ncbi:MAG: type II toxin-antitoxin system Phd/YefM family antitoxin [Chloroflexota bacterium]|nr:type II toxin-antitoxin system Phd/YefM family antitoxin [Chloroflexota bacterium]MDQ6905442.1 type II toxin-antitoxin system Phd/YefM family antitoxin [Chloroflexota bacterium]
MVEISFAEASEQFSEMFDRAADDKERIIVTRQGKRVVAIVPIEDMEAMEEIEDRIDLEEAAKARAEAKEKGTISLAEMKAKHGL